MRKRNIKKQVWIDAKEDELLKKKSKEAGLTESEFIRSIIKGYRIGCIVFRIEALKLSVSTKALAVGLLQRDKTTIEEARFVDVKAHNTSICAYVPTLSRLAEVVSVLALKNAEVGVLAADAPPRRVCRIYNK